MFNTQHYCSRCRDYVEQCEHGTEAILDISGTQGREMLTEFKQPPEWFMRPEISALILEDLQAGRDVFL